jgi:hypothetical protein
MSNSKKNIIWVVALMILCSYSFYYIAKHHFYHQYAFNAKLVTQIPVKNLIDKSILQKFKNHLPMYSIERLKNLKTIFTDIDTLPFIDNSTVLVVYGGELDLKINNEKFDRDDLTPRKNQRYVGIKLKSKKNICSIYIYNSKRCMLIP